MKNRNLDHSDNWATPTYFYNELEAEFNFDFDPCPYNTGELEFDGLKINWGGAKFHQSSLFTKTKRSICNKSN